MKYFAMFIMSLFLGFISIPKDNTIKVEDLFKHINYLCSEQLKGRLSGSEGYELAAQYCQSRFKEYGLKSMLNNDNYYQYLSVEYNDIDKAEMQIIIDGKTTELKLGKDFICRGFTGSGNIKSDVVFCGYGISHEDYDDYKGVDVKNKIVMIFKQNPKWNINDKSFDAGYPRVKAENAFKHGAVGIILVSLPNDSEPQDIIGSVLHGPGEQNQNFPQVHITIEAASKYFESKGITLKELQTKIDENKKPSSMDLNNQAVINIKAYYEGQKRTMNVVGVLEGTDPKLKDEYIVIGAHLDHVGRQANIYFPGANDNASGSAAVLGIAEAFVKNNIKPKRSVIFVLFASEEQGLFGAKAFAENPPVPIERISAMFNLDCIGFGDSIQIGNGKSAPQLWKIAKKNDNEKNINFMVENTWNGGGADAQPFHEKGVPCIYFVTTNSYKHLHMLSDKPETLNKNLYEKIANLAYYTLVDVANYYNREEIIK